MKKLTTRTLVLIAMLAALQVVLSKFLMIQATPSVRFSLDSTPILLAGLWFGPLAGGAVGVLGDMLGTILFPTAGAWYPPLTAAYGIIGVVAGLFGRSVRNDPRFLRIASAVAAAEIAGSLLWKSLALSWLIGIPFWAQFTARLTPVCVNMAADLLLVTLLYRRLSEGVWSEPVGEARKKTEIEETHGMTYMEAIEYIHSTQWRGSRLGLSRTQTLLDAVGNPERKLKFVHVAGTNGKGSTCSMLASMFQQAGYRTGLYISPFINRFNERMQVNYQEIPDDTLAEITAYVKPFAEAQEDHPTEFELITVIAFLYFLQAKCDIVVLEVGMGGEFDSTNVIPVPELAVITNIGLDHTRELGPTISAIAKTKAGIVKPGGDVLIYGHNDEAETAIRAVAKEKDAHLTVADFGRITNVRPSLDALTFDFLPYTALRCPLIGEYQLKNAAVALTAAELLQKKGWKLGDGAIRAGMERVVWPARFEVLRRNPLFVADGGHNPQGIRAAVDSIRLHFPGKRIVMLLGVMADKDVSHMLPIIREVSDTFVTVRPNNPRAMDAKTLADQLVSLGVSAVPCDSVPAGVEKAAALAGKDGVAFALGSLYMLGDVRDCFPRDKERKV